VVASSGADGTMKLWETSSGRALHDMTCSLGIVHSMAFSRDGKLLAGGGGGGKVTLWDVATGRQVGTLLTHSAQLISVAFSADGKTLVRHFAVHVRRLWHWVRLGPIRPRRALECPVSATAPLARAKTRSSNVPAHVYLPR